MIRWKQTTRTSACLSFAGNAGLTVIRLSRSVVGHDEQLALARVIEEGYLGMGRFTREF